MAGSPPSTLPPSEERTSPAGDSSSAAPDTTRQATGRLSAIARLEYAALAFVAVLLTSFAFVFFYFDVDVAELNSYGYGGLFVVSLVSAASIVMPMPGAAAITGAGALLDPIFGVPVPLAVGIVAGVAEALGEFTGYAAGYGGSPFFRNRPSYPRVKAWMERRGMVTMFLLSCIPNPLVDVAGVAAGAVQMKIWRFFVSVLAGKFFKNVYLALGGLALAEIIERVFL